MYDYVKRQWEKKMFCGTPWESVKEALDKMGVDVRVYNKPSELIKDFSEDDISVRVSTNEILQDKFDTPRLSYIGAVDDEPYWNCVNFNQWKYVLWEYALTDNNKRLMLDLLGYRFTESELSKKREEVRKDILKLVNDQDDLEVLDMMYDKLCDIADE